MFSHLQESFKRYSSKGDHRCYYILHLNSPLYYDEWYFGTTIGWMHVRQSGRVWGGEGVPSGARIPGFRSRIASKNGTSSFAMVMHSSFPLSFGDFADIQNASSVSCTRKSQLPGGTPQFYTQFHIVLTLLREVPSSADGLDPIPLNALLS